MSIKVFVDGAEGTTGLHLRQRLLSHPEVNLMFLSEENRKNAKLRVEIFREVDLIFLCLPESASKETMKLINLNSNISAVVIDSSSFHRVDPSWVYGFPELKKGQKKLIINSKRIANPGCYASAAISIIRPLVEGGVLQSTSPLVIHAVSGYTGGGKEMIKHFTQPDSEPFIHYGLSMNHKHLKEIVSYGLLKKIPIFCPSVGTFPQGMTVSIPVHFEWCRKDISGEKIRSTLYNWYKDSNFISVKPLNKNSRLTKKGFLRPDILVGSNKIEISIFSNEDSQQAWILAQLDNLGKGASGSAVQNMNLRFGFEENLGTSNLINV